MPQFDMTTLGPAVQQAARDLAANLIGLGKADLVNVVAAVQEYAGPAAQWEIDRQAARAANDDAKLDALDRTLEQLEANAWLRVAELGIAAQAATERQVAAVLSLLAKTALAALVV